MTAASEQQSASLTGALLSRRYTLGRLLGAGGMGSVYESESPDDGRPLAIKILRVDFLHDEDVKARFVEEARTCQRLIHPNVVRVLDVGEAEDGSPYIVMERLEGVPLGAYTRSGVRVPLQHAAAIMQGVLAGLGAAHAQGIVHRDLKPDNVFLAREPSGAFSPKILDFGIAKVMDAAGGMGNKTRTGVLLGTPAYMSPEQIKNAKDVDARADLWSAGVMLYEMLAGRPAFPAPTEYARLAAVLNTTPPPLEQADPALSRLSSLVQRAMQKDRQQRFASALDMARALAATVGADPPQSTAAAGMAIARGATPLSRLPLVPSVFMQGSSLPPPPTRGPEAPAPATAPTRPLERSPAAGPGGTLASAKSSPASAPPPQVVTVAGAGTLPSENLPMLSPHGAHRGVPAWAVALLVVGALAAGFLLGLAMAPVR